MNIENPEISRTLAKLIQEVPFEGRLAFMEDARKHSDMEEFVRELKKNKRKYWGKYTK